MSKKYIEFWSNLSQSAKAEIESSVEVMELRRGEVVYREGDTPRGLYFVEKGLVGLVLIGATSGKEHLLRFFKQDQFFGHRSLFANEGYHGTATALEPTILKVIPRQVILRLLESQPHLYKDIVFVLAKELRRCEVQHVMILENQILSRTAQSLIYLKDLHPDHKWTRQEISNFCASTVSTIIKALAELENRGLIKQEGRSIEVLNREALIALQDHDNI